MAAKRRNQNPWRPVTEEEAARLSYGKPPEDFTGKGEEAITGKGGGHIRFRDGIVVGLGIATVERKWTPEDDARSIRLDGVRNQPIRGDGPHQQNPIPDSVVEMLSQPGLAMFAASLIKAAHDGDSELFRRVADAVKYPLRDFYPDRPGSDLDILRDAVWKAAEQCRGIPTREMVRDILERIPALDGQQKRFPTVGESDKLKLLLGKIGFQWLPGKKRGEHLRRKLPDFPD